MVTIEAGTRPGYVVVTFQVPDSIWAADTIHLVGDFNDWDRTSHPFSGTSGDGPWQLTLELEQGRVYEYRYLVDGTGWQTDWNGACRVTNPFGTDNAVLET